MPNRLSRPPALLSAAAFVVVVAGMQAAQPIIVPFLLAIFLAIISAPPLFWLEQRGLPKALAMLIVAAVVVAVAVFVGSVVGASVNDFSQNLPAYQARFETELIALNQWAAEWGVAVTDTQLLQLLDPAVAFGLMAKLLNSLGGIFGNAFLILLTVLFMLFEASGFPNKLRAAFGESSSSVGHFRDFSDKVNRYLAIKTATSLLTAVVIYLWLLFLGVDYPLLWAMLAFFLNYVPNIGSIIAAVPVVLLAVVQLDGSHALWVAVGYLVVNNVVGNFIEPRFMGIGLGLSSLVVFLSLIFWGWILGPVGMFLSVPLTITLKIALDSSEQTRWIAILLGPDTQGASESIQVPERLTAQQLMEQQRADRDAD
ncbi:MAG: AI-2E family transporter [Gammaproteobacteria bacterium]|nr:AI-2E family transporter [Gammaproteobacteria bacterium]